MGCNSDYMRATHIEKEMSKVMCLLDELNGIPINQSYWNGYHPEVYNKKLSNDTCDRCVILLCDSLQKTDVSKYSLEMQIWWRDHRQADKQRIVQELAESKKKEDIKIALSKLSDYEKTLLGLKDEYY